jgi:hypothetical protein
MPFKSEAQRRLMYAKHPKIAKRWQKHTPKGADLPERVKKASTLGLVLGIMSIKQAAALPGVGARIGGLLRTLGGRTEIAARGLGKHLGVDPTRSLREGTPDARRLKLQLLGGATAAGGAYGLHRLLSREPERRPMPPPYPQWAMPQQASLQPWLRG